jgi:hypothetical protein
MAFSSDFLPTAVVRKETESKSACSLTGTNK